MLLNSEGMTFDKGILSFVFPDGFWITNQHPDDCVWQSISLYWIEKWKLKM